MVAGLYGIGRFSGAGVMALAYAVCLLLCLGIGALFRCNRTPQGRKRLLISVGVAAVLCDALLFVLLFPRGEYMNRGIGMAFGGLLYPAVLCITAAIVTALNHEDESTSR